MIKRPRPPAEPPTPDDQRWAAVLEQKRERYRKPRVRVERSTSKTLYSVPRRFDIATLLVVSLVYSLLFTLLRVLDSPWPVYAFLGMLSVVVGVAQALFPFGNEPRVASMVAGVGHCVVWSVVGYILSGDWSVAIVGVVSSMIAGPPLGYLMGAMEAGVFLLADKVRQRWFPERPAAGDVAVDFESIDS